MAPKTNMPATDFLNQEIIIVRVIVYTSGGFLSDAKVCRTTGKSVITDDGRVVPAKKCVMLGKEWVFDDAD